MRFQVVGNRLKNVYLQGIRMDFPFSGNIVYALLKNTPAYHENYIWDERNYIWDVLKHLKHSFAPLRDTVFQDVTKARKQAFRQACLWPALSYPSAVKAIDAEQIKDITSCGLRRRIRISRKAILVKPRGRPDL